MATTKFKYEEKTYEVDVQDTYYLNKDIKLPDGRILRANGWLEVFPPYPMSLSIVDSDNLTLATEV